MLSHFANLVNGVFLKGHLLKHVEIIGKSVFFSCQVMLPMVQ